MDSLPCSCTTRSLDKTIHSTTDHTCALKPRCETTDTEATNDRQSPVEEISVNSSHRGEHNLVCLKCLQLRTGSSSSAEDSTNNSVCECFKVTNCTRIRDYLEKGKDENYFEEFMLPKKVLSKLALVLGKHVACERRRISGCRFFGGEKRQPEIRLRSQASKCVIGVVCEVPRCSST